MSAINNGGQAFPWHERGIHHGMTLRDWFATHATEVDILAILDPPFESTMTRIITRYEARYIHADAMIKAREVKP